MITVIDIEKKDKIALPEGYVRNLLDPSADGTRARVAVEEVQAGKTARLSKSDKTQVVYILEGKDAKVTYSSNGTTTEKTAQRRAGVYLEPGEEASVTASSTPLS